MKPQPAGKPNVPAIVHELRSLQRRRSIVIKSRNMQANRLQAIVAGQEFSYETDLSESERKKRFLEASALIKRVVALEAECQFSDIIRVTSTGIQAFEDVKGDYEKSMVALAKQLPVAEWVKAPEQRGFGLLFLAIVIGETGDLSGYTNPAKVWRRMGCAPYSFDGKTQMGATWRSGKTGKLPPLEWEHFGYSPRRRSIAYLIGEGIVKQNGSGPYRQRYDTAKASAEINRPDWTACKCNGSGKGAKGVKCSDCGGRGKKLKHCHLHAMLLATKLLLKNLWIEWRKQAGDYDPSGEYMAA